MRICGGVEDCAWLAPPECPGFGCTPALDVDALTESSAGVCWADLPFAGAEQCTACANGEACAQRTPDQLVCVSTAVCEALWDAGAVDVCRYADKSAYDHQPLSVPQGPCPGGAPPQDIPTLCGGGCGACDDHQRCSGLSPLHPYGLCALVEEPEHPKPDNVYTCSLEPGGAVVQDCSGSIYSPTVCAIFDTPPADAAVARRYGFCLGVPQCIHAAAHMPGGLLCFDETGAQIAP